MPHLADKDLAAADVVLVLVGDGLELAADDQIEFVIHRHPQGSLQLRPGVLAAADGHRVAVEGHRNLVGIRVRRMLGVFAAGRILNEKLAKSQAVGAMIWGVGSALHEAAILDLRHGHFVNHDLGDYHVPSHADIPAIEAHFISEVDDKTNPLKIKGVGELGISGAGAAVANAVYNACGVRIRDYPLTLDKVLTGLGAPGPA